MNTFNRQLALYPTPAPKMEVVLEQEELLPAIEQSCEYLYAPEGSLTESPREKIRAHFQQFFQWMDGSYHLELLLGEEAFDWQGFLQALHQFFPQFAWLKAQTETPKHGRQIYRFDFIPLVFRKTGFPFAVQLEESVAQQFGLEPKEALERVEQLLQELVEQQTSKKQPAPVELVEEQAQELSVSVDRIEEADSKQEKQSKARLRAVNQKLELVI